MILALKPRPPKEAVPILLTYLRSGRASEDVKSSLVSGLVRLAPAAPEVVQAVSDVMAQKLKAEARIEILNALGEPAVESPVLIDRMIDAMDDPNRAVQLTAIAAVKRNGLKATSRAASVLLRLANTATDADIRKAAREALEGGQSC